MKLSFSDTTLDVSSDGKIFTLTLDDKTIRAEVLHADNGKLDILVDDRRVTAYVSSDNTKRWVTVNGQTFVLTKSSGAKRSGGKHDHGGELTAPMPGQVRAVNVSEGDEVTKGQTLLVLEAMKMEIRIHAPRPGKVLKLFVKQGQTVERDQNLIEVEENLQG
ncbi:MAG TPA: biotin/lipoyl-containing protein [Anaerolineales bacterium]|nr:biotin/lipoyl-containing protein [Anaerolineales bacterium]